VQMSDKGMADAGSFELTDEEVVGLLESMGFEVLKYEMLEGGMGLGYIQDPQSMLQNLYRCSHWFVRRTPAEK
jgi:carnosine N-methyltransferase